MVCLLVVCSTLLSANCSVQLPSILRDLLSLAQPQRFTPPSADTLASTFTLSEWLAPASASASASASPGSAADPSSFPSAVAADDDGYVYVYCSAGLWRVGTGFGGTTQGKVYAHNAAVAVKFPKERVRGCSVLPLSAL